MIFFGNDIVSLSCPFNKKSFTTVPYLKKILSKSEIRFLHKSQSISWPALIWSCKESTYKIILKKGTDKAFAPAFFETRVVDQAYLDHQVLSIVKYKNDEFYVISYIHNDFIHSIASDKLNNFKYIKHEIIKTDNRNISDQMHKSIISSIAIQINLPNDNFQLLKDKNNIPSIRNISSNRNIPVSMSHDNNYFSFAYVL